ncbi:hypothetical protein O6H91_12G062300 [Diphasiastrum complanatum]|uniref:Uncharacterized protein n=8 Tax=Diphasiastrum complanatum TaxID=34168 RepID=A0ACC2C2V5_DIPCM|nr:hypothetical protein O6H91_12G062300 [Diphasiastrum complanatum]KAJ7536251.1 hypothetical protein O6H91_12G062300 [Diphasiastrum complanatum]KAJ7536252.1 hypothetical protein O6H91_12G062300 [Diphasiastrum complanatum]KAJ7536253.1 hypothetical protein O6H91_12G062300 [Diphasiastrum complanatum]KAJ7536254.1 hypothetical protein O6H91_12G062300 [Diphasiastrum complanatum]
MEEATSSRGGEIDTAPPFESVRAAVTMFGERAEPGGAFRVGILERQAHKDQQFYQVQEDLAQLQEQLAVAETAKKQALDELEETKGLVEDTKKKLEEVIESQASGLRAPNLEESENVDANNSIRLKEELETYKQQHTAAVSDLEAAKKEIARLKLALHAATVEVREAEAMAVEAVKKSEELLKELLESCELDKAELVFEPEAEGTSKHSAELRVSNTVTSSISCEEVENLRKQLASAKDLDLQLAASSNMLSNALAELAAAKTSETRMVAIANEARADLIKAAADLERSRAAEAHAIEVAEATEKELQVAKLKLQKLTEENASLPLVVESLKVEVEKAKAELLALKKKESKTITAAIAANANADLEKAKAELSAALLAEGKAKEAMESLTIALQQVTLEANEAKSAATGAVEEAQNGRLEAEQARSTISVLEVQLREALNVSEEAKLAETLATEQLKSLKETFASSISENIEPGAVLPVLKEEYEALNKKLQETEDLASKRIAAVEAQVEAVRASERELLIKLEAAKEEIEANKLAAKDALQRAEKAAAAKSAVENELRKRRVESEQRRRIAEAAAFQSSPLNGDLLTSTPEDKTVQVESLSQVQQVKTPHTDEKTIHMEGITLPKKNRKPSISKRLGSYLSRRKD